MKLRLCLLLLPVALGIAGLTGCCRRGCGPGYVASAPPCAPAPFAPSQALMPLRYDPLPGPVPPARVDVLPPSAVMSPGLRPMQPPPPTPPAPLDPAEVRGYGPPPVPPPEPMWRPSPDAVPSPAPRDPVRLFPPESSEPPRPDATPPQPDAAPDRPLSPSLPAGIPQFATARDRVASGLKPSLEGLDWLKQDGYRTVLHIRRPGEDDSADRRQVEDRRGLKFISLELSSQNLRDTVNQFNQLVGDSSLQPVFVYDHDGTLQGLLWYLHFRLVELAGDEDARIRAGRLGLREDGSPEQRELWLAVQNLLSQR